jgi:hypothetical protein
VRDSHSFAFATPTAALLMQSMMNTGSSLLHAHTASFSNTSPSNSITPSVFPTTRMLTFQISSDHESYPPPRRRFRASNERRTLYNRQDLQVTVHRTVECDMELSPPCELEKHPLPPLSHVGAARCAVILPKEARRASGSPNSSATSSSSGFGGSRSGVVSPALGD